MMLASLALTSEESNHRSYTGHTETVNEISIPVTLLTLAVMYFFAFVVSAMMLSS